ncbi:peptidyl-prolyl cis-trans isomerase (rotamase D) [Proteus vulgaris]|uniref:peptidylprolyl isomerase n=1 Tax=Proteus vulgaris TaxID=585 RepID=UPI000658CCE2|nr:peptidylprolyl isomerase [Proteus vulgaris]WIF73021.1 peptidylprolyl isomerase [Proteus vulgaris]CRL62389.1 Peptidyl-prolyl cis-trans isomerase D [Proteus vulgaris]SUC13911.1 peptidyl-prolyl cis-trans isomerase (rotamase D) [Proteus vulgaris]
MMDNIRSTANNPFIKILLAVIILSFVLTGVGGYLFSSGVNDAAEVNGYKISRSQLEQAYQQRRAQLQQDMGENFAALASSEEGQKLIRQQSLDLLINQALLDQFAQNLGISAGDQQIRDAIFALPYFQTNGKFDNKKYVDLLKGNNIDADAFAEGIRQNLINQQLRFSIQSTDFALESEVKEFAGLMLQSRNVRLASLDIQPFLEKETASDDEVKAFYEQNNQMFIAPEQFKVSYIQLNAQKDLNSINITDDEAKAYYDNNIDEFTAAGQKQYSILVLADEAAAKAAAEELKKGADFVTLVKEKSVDTFSAKQNGSLGWITIGQELPELANASLTEKGQLSAPVKISNGYAIFRLDDIKQSVVKPFDEVKTDLLAKMRENKAIDDFFALQQRVSQAASNDNDTLAPAAKAGNVTVVDTDWFDENTVPAPLNNEKLTQLIFGGSLVDENGPTGMNSDMVTLGNDSAFVVRVEGYKPSASLPLDKVRDQVVMLVKQQKASQAMNTQAQKILAALKEGKGDEALKAANLSFGNVESIVHSSATDAVQTAIFAMPKPADGKKEYGMTNVPGTKVVFIQLDSVTDGKPTSEQLEFMANLYRAQMGEEALQLILRDLKDNAKIEIFDKDYQ